MVCTTSQTHVGSGPKSIIRPPQELNDSQSSKRTVKFATTEATILVLSRAEIPTNRLHMLWYNRAEMKEIQKENLRCIKDMKAGTRLNDGENGRGQPSKEDCSRGLEKFFWPDQMKEYQQKWQNLVLTVLQEQSHQKTIGRNEPWQIARISRVQSQRARNLAMTTGAADAIAVQRMAPSQTLQQRTRRIFQEKQSRTRSPSPNTVIVDASLRIIKLT